MSKPPFLFRPTDEHKKTKPLQIDSDDAKILQSALLKKYLQKQYDDICKKEPRLLTAKRIELLKRRIHIAAIKSIPVEEL